jgi:hypothetical protein
MRPLPVLLAIALLGTGTNACGSNKSTSSAVRPSNAARTGSATATSTASAAAAQDYTKIDGDKDNDIGLTASDDTNSSALNYAHAASTADRRAVTALVKRYYATAAAGDGAKACSMLYITLAEAVVEDYGHGSAGPSYLSQGTTCPAVLGLLFKHLHGQLTAELAVLKVRRVRLDRRHGFAILSFGKLPERKISIREQRHTWKINAPLDDELP